MRRPMTRAVLACLCLALAATAFAAAPARQAPAGASRNTGSSSASNNKSSSAAADKKSAAATFEVYQDKGGEYRWRLRARNSQILAIAPDGYKDKRAVLSAIESVRKDVADAPVEEQPASSGDAKNGKSDGGSGGRK